MYFNEHVKENRIDGEQWEQSIKIRGRTITPLTHFLTREIYLTSPPCEDFFV